MTKKLLILVSALMVLSLVLAACAQPTPETIVEEVIKTVVVTEIGEVEGEPVVK